MTESSKVTRSQQLRRGVPIHDGGRCIVVAHCASVVGFREATDCEM